MDLPNIQIFPLAVGKIIYHSASNPNTEIAGFLIGYFVDEKTTIITDARTGRQTGTSVHVTIDNMELARIAEELEILNTKEKVVGWYHSHPNMGAHFFSSTDIATQKRYQMFSPQSVGFVVDPAKFIRTKDLNDVDLNCWIVENNNAVKMDFEIIIDSKSCLKNILTHIKYPKRINVNVINIIEDLLLQIEIPINYNLAQTIKLGYNKSKLIGNQDNDLILKISTHTIILSTFLFFTLLFLTLI